MGQDNGNTNKTENIDEGKEGNENEQQPVKKDVLRKQHSILKKQKQEPNVKESVDALKSQKSVVFAKSNEFKSFEKD